MFEFVKASGQPNAQSCRQFRCLASLQAIGARSEVPVKLSSLSRKVCLRDKTEVRWELFSAHVLMRHLAQSCEAVPPVVYWHKASALSSPTQAISIGNKTSYGKKICRRIHWSLLGLIRARREVK